MLAAGFAPAVKYPLRWSFVLRTTASACQNNQQLTNVQAQAQG